MIRSSREWSASKSSSTVVEVSSRMLTETTWNSSWKSAVAASGRLSASRFYTTISAVCGTRAPFHRRGRNGLTGVTASRLEPSGMIGPWAERL